jgi:peptide/nickel transport system substrate-binding protein
LVAAAGATGKTIDVIAPSNTKMSAPVAQVIERDIQNAGLKARILTLDAGEALKRDHAGTFDLFIGWFAGYADPAMSLAWWNPAYAGFNKEWAKSDGELNALIDKSLSAAPGSDRATTIRAACARIAQDGVMIPLVSKDAIVAYRSDKVSAVIPPVEGYAVPLRHLAEFGAK